MTITILVSGLGYTNACEFCGIKNYCIIQESRYYDYIHIIARKTKMLAEKLTDEKLNETLKTRRLVAAFNAGWVHPRNANQCIGALIDLISGFIIAFEIFLHVNEDNGSLNNTTKHAKSMEKLSLEQIKKKNYSPPPQKLSKILFDLL